MQTQTPPCESRHLPAVVRLANRAESVFQQCLSAFCFHDTQKDNTGVRGTWEREGEMRRTAELLSILWEKVECSQENKYHFLSLFSVSRLICLYYPIISNISWGLVLHQLYMLQILPILLYFHFLNNFLCWAEVLTFNIIQFISRMLAG